MFLFFQNCKKDNNETPQKCPDNNLIIANVINSSITTDTFDTLISPPSRGHSAEFFFDINSDGIDDFRFYAFYNYSPCIYTSELSINTLSDSAKIIVNDTINSPAILSFGDTVQYYSNWKAGELTLFDYYSQCDMGGGGTESRFGTWYGIENQYIGLKLELNNLLFYAWVNISVVETSGIFVHKVSYINSCDN